MKRNLTLIIMLISAICVAQENKFKVGDFGLRYGVSFNGTAIQGLNFSGLVTKRIEVGCAVNVQYSATKSDNFGTANIYYNGINESGTSTSTSTSRTITISISPFAVNHFKIKSNLDIYTGGRLTVGPNAHTIFNNSDSKTTGYNYYSETIQSYKYPWGYQVGGGLIIGAQYFFYKRLAIGLEGNIGVSYSSATGNATAQYQQINTGAYNNPNNLNVTSNIQVPYNIHTFSVATASSIGINLTFYMDTKRKVKKDEKQPKSVL